MAVRITPSGLQSVSDNPFQSGIPSSSGSGSSSSSSSRRSGGGSDGGRSSTPEASTVLVLGNTVFINGQGFSVRPQDQAKFIQDQTGGRGSSASQAILQATANVERMRVEAVRKASEQKAQQERQQQIQRQKSQQQIQQQNIQRTISLQEQLRQQSVSPEQFLLEKTLRDNAQSIIPPRPGSLEWIEQSKPSRFARDIIEEGPGKFKEAVFSPFEKLGITEIVLGTGKIIEEGNLGRLSVDIGDDGETTIFSRKVLPPPLTEEEIKFPKKQTSSGMFTLEEKEFNVDEFITKFPFSSSDVIAKVSETRITKGVEEINQEIEIKAQEFQSQVATQVQPILNDLQQKVNNGELTVKQAEVEYNKQTAPIIKNISKNFDETVIKNAETKVGELTSKEKQFIKTKSNKIRSKVAPAIFLANVGTGIVIGGGLGLVGGLGGATGAAAVTIAESSLAAATIFAGPELVKSAIENPTAFGVETAGFIVGGKIGTKGASAILGTNKVISVIEQAKITQKKLRANKPNLKTEIRTSVDYSKAKLVGKNPNGSLQWEVKGKAITEIWDVKTKKLLKKVGSTEVTGSAISNTIDGVIKIQTDIFGATQGPRGVRVKRNKPELTIKRDVSRAKSTGTFEEVDLFGLGPKEGPLRIKGKGKGKKLKGKIKTELEEVGVIRDRLSFDKGTPKLDSKFVERGAKRKGSGLADVEVNMFGEKVKIKGEGIEKVLVKEQKSRSKVRGDVFEDLFGVKKHTRNINQEIVGFGVEFKKSVGKKTIQRQARKFPTTQKPSRGIGEGLGTSEVPIRRFTDTRNVLFEELALKANLPKRRGSPPPSSINKILFPDSVPIKSTPPPSAPAPSVNQLLTGQEPRMVSVAKQKVAVEATVQADLTTLSTSAFKPVKRAPVKPTSSGGSRFDIIRGLKGESLLDFSSTKGGLLGAAFGAESRFKDLSDTKTKTKTKTKSIFGSGEKEDTLTGLDSISITNLGFIQGTESVQQPKQSTSQITSLKVSPLQTPSFNFFIPPTVTPGITRPVKDLTPKPPTIIRPIPSDKGSKKKVPGFQPQVKVGKKWVNVGSIAPEKKALGRAFHVADITTSRSARIVKTKVKVKKPKKIDKRASELRPKFRMFKQKRGVRTPLQRNTFVELSKHAVDTPQEKRKLTVNALLTRRRNARRNNFFGF